MPIPRALLVNPEEPGFYHCLSRCVRRAYLFGDGYEHRRDWIRKGLMELSSIFAIDIAAYSVLSNHFHTVVRTDPHRANAWSRTEVVERWSRVYPASVVAWAKSLRSGAEIGSIRPRGPGSGVRISSRKLKEAIRVVAKNEGCVKALRRRLSSLSEFMQRLKQPVAVRANREDGCKGHFWEERFKSPPLLDDASVLLGMVYVDLNLVRAAMASTPESSDHTSIQDRIHVLQHFQRQVGNRECAPRRAEELLTRLGEDDLPTTAEEGIWLAPIDCHAAQFSTSGSAVLGLLPITLEDYLELVDTTGRVIRKGKAGAIPASLPPILARVGLDPQGWSTFWLGTKKLVGSAVGTAASLAKEAARRKQSWVRSVWDVTAAG